MSLKQLLPVYLIVLINCSFGHSQIKDIDFSLDQIVRNYFAPSNPAPVFGESYTIGPLLLAESPIDGSNQGVVIGLDMDPVTGGINDAVMDGLPDRIGVDLAEQLGMGSSSDVIVRESVVSLGVNPVNQRFDLMLTITIESTATELVWDTLDQDLFDPGDIDFDGNFNEPDGTFDTGDGVPDQPFPLDPIGITIAFDLNNDGDATNDPAVPLVSQGVSLSGVQLAPLTGLVAGTYEVRNFRDEVADIDLSGTPDGPFPFGCNISICDQLTGSWNGSVGVIFGHDEDPRTTAEVLSGSVKTISLGFLLSSETEVEIEPIVICGDVNFDQNVDLLDIQPFVDLISANLFRPEADINGDGVVDLLDVAPFVAKLTGG